MCYVDTKFSGVRAQADYDNVENFMLRTGYVVTYVGCPLLWCSKLQTQIALSNTETEYIALSQAMFEAIPFMTLMKELSFIFDIHLPKTEVSCKLFEYNQGFIAVAESNKFSPRKQIAIK